ncbi:3-hydroxybutyryl-CoA dehydrogenase [Streptomyces olivaceoviridis]|uniref:3-hydroxyacyl-CoA dehydrogenase family protein n=1 Tax=Streptomyces olivaceoviridis TaxID=1921 RepID=UPI001675BC0A|nr:3-hydroxyacyl-CoA dehydrogenase family protein [Streptomyces olivaceoviridis]GGZ29147.1 3-hydroxybutyryl-CoA dehydrogenase [Streptomyces olivaceoviridis]
MKTEPIAVLGAGVMGVGITTLLAGHGLPVRLVDNDPVKLAQAPGRIRRELRMAQLMGVLPPGREEGEVSLHGDLSAVRGARVVIEAITENADLKTAVLADVSALVPPATPLVSNTSSIPIDELADAVRHPADLIGTHFMNPPALIGTTEVIRGVRTGEATLEAVRGLLREVGRRPVVVRDAPGFVTSRLLHPMINDAARVVQEGTASAEDVDALMQGCLGHPTGPLRTADLIGIDNLVDSLWVLLKRTGDEGCRPCDLLLQKVADGHHGRKTGQGFYEYEESTR